MLVDFRPAWILVELIRNVSKKVTEVSLLNWASSILRWRAVYVFILCGWWSFLASHSCWYFNYILSRIKFDINLGLFEFLKFFIWKHIKSTEYSNERVQTVKVSPETYHKERNQLKNWIFVEKIRILQIKF